MVFKRHKENFQILELQAMLLPKGIVKNAPNWLDIGGLRYQALSYLA